MIRRALGLVILAMIVAAAIYYWKAQPGLPKEAERLGTEGAEKLAAVGQKLADAKTTAAVETALGLKRSLKPYSIDADTKDGVVTLHGEVPRDDIKAMAEAAAAAVPDVRQVANELRVNPALAPPAEGGRTVGENLDDKALEIQVNLAFSLNRNLKGTDLKVRAYRRDVTVGGVVDTPEQRALAIELARETPNVGNIVDEIQVRGQIPTAGGAIPASPLPAAPPAEAALAAPRSLAPYGLRVREQAGRLILSGKVRTAAEKDLAALVARDAAAAPVENALEIKP